MIASAGTRLTKPSAVNELVIKAVAVLLCKSAVRPTPAANAAKRFLKAPARSRRRSGPNARSIPLWTMCRPHSSSDTPPIRSRRTKLPMTVRFEIGVEWSGYQQKREYQSHITADRHCERPPDSVHCECVGEWGH